MPPKTQPAKDLHSWTSLARPFKRRDKDTYVTVIAVASLFGIILFIIQGIMPVILIISLVFLFYVLSTVEPEKVNYKITDEGIKIADKMTYWDQMNRFWFTERFGHTLLIIDTLSLPGRTEIVISPTDKQKIQSIVEDHIPHEKSAPNFYDKATNLLSKAMR